jgi:gliding motility-associated-like protein
MKKIIFSLISIMLSVFAVSAQEFPMDDILYTECSGNFTDSQGLAADYLPGETFTTTFCSPFPTDLTQIAFTQFDLAPGDVLIAYDGDSSNAPFIGAFGSFLAPSIIEASATNPTGCLTFVFTSNPTSPGAPGWSANVICVDNCQTITSAVTTTPAPDADGVLRICQGDTVDMVGNPNFSVDGTGATLEFLMPDGSRVSGTTASMTLANPGVYVVDFIVTDPTGCRDRSLEDVKVLVSTDPDFTGTIAEREIVCFGDTVQISGVVESTQFTAEVAPPITGTTFLPDRSNSNPDPRFGEYETCIDVQGLAPGATLTDVTNLVSVFINMEHSYLGDLEIVLRAPNGAELLLQNRTGGGTFAGEPIDVDTNLNPGVGYLYRFTEQGTATQTWAQAQIGNATLPAGDYLADDPFSVLLGTELNGLWCLNIKDWLFSDNGYIFEWGLEFDPSIVPNVDSFIPGEVTEAWQANPDIIATDVVGDTTTITVQPSVVGQNCYTFEFNDDFGCTYTEEVCIEMAAEIITATPTAIETCESLGNTTVNLRPAGTEALNGLPQLDYSITYHESQADAEDGINGITNITNFTVTTDTDVFIRIFNRRTECFNVEILSISFSDVAVNPSMDIDECDSVPLDNITSFNLTMNEAEILGTQDPNDVSVSYYTTAAAATAGVLGTEIPDPTNYENTDITETIHVRVEDSSDAGCFATGSFVINILSGPPIGIAPDLSECDTAPFDLRLEFDLSLQDDSVLDGLSSTDYSVAYFNSEADAFADVNQLSSLYTAADGEVIVARLTDDLTGCQSTSTFSVTVEGCEVIFPEGFSPNNDGTNETFEIPNIQQYANFELKVFNRLGSVVYETNAVNYEEFAGVPNSGLNSGDGLLPVGTYFYVMKFNEPGLQDIASWLYINY